MIGTRDSITELVARRQWDLLREALLPLHPSDIAEIISQLDQHHVHEVLDTLDDEAAADTIQEVSPDLQLSLIRNMEPERAADILEEMEPDDAADILGDLEPERAQDLLSRMEADEAEDVRELLTFDDDSAGGLMTTDVVTVPPTATADEAIGLVRQQAAEMDNVYYVYVVDEGERLLGVLSLRELIVAEPSTPIGRPAIGAPPPTGVRSASERRGNASATAVKSLMISSRCNRSSARNPATEKLQGWLVMRT